MSKIFEALNKDSGQMADLILPMVGQKPAAAARQPEPVSPEAAAPGAVDVSANAELLTPNIRTVALQVAAPSPILPFEDSHSPASEQYRVLRTKIVQHPKQPRFIMVSSPVAKDGKSVSAVNLAGALSLKKDTTVLLLDADLRRSNVHQQLGVAAAPGLVDVLTGKCTLEEALVRAQEYPNLFVLPAGTPGANPVELLDSPQWRALCARLRRLFRYVVADSPPLALVADYDLIQTVCDGVILVVRPDHTSRPLLKQALESLAKPKFLGVLLNCVPDWFLGRRASTEYYYYSRDIK